MLYLQRSGLNNSPLSVLHKCICLLDFSSVIRSYGATSKNVPFILFQASNVLKICLTPFGMMPHHLEIPNLLDKKNYSAQCDKYYSRSATQICLM